MRLFLVLAFIVAVNAAEVVSSKTTPQTQPVETVGSTYSEIVDVDKIGKLKFICFGERGLCYARRLNQYDKSGGINPNFHYNKWALLNIDVSDE